MLLIKILTGNGTEKQDPLEMCLVSQQTREVLFEKDLFFVAIHIT